MGVCERGFYCFQSEVVIGYLPRMLIGFVVKFIYFYFLLLSGSFSFGVILLKAFSMGFS